jgi:hypothetical protein
MSAPIPLRAYATSGLVSVEVVQALLTFGEPMITETIVFPGARRDYRAWLRLRSGGRTFGHPWHSTPQFAATALLEKLEGRR